jgi:Mn2+/Fe2+ NRAMP family transporter
VIAVARYSDAAYPSVAHVLRRPHLILWRTLGPGLIAGASDIDPTTVASLAMIGATTGYGLVWLVLLVIPMLVVVQMISAAVGTVWQAGLEDAIRARYGRPWAFLTLLLVLAVNLLTLAADLEGGGAALGLLTSWPYQWFILPVALAAGALLLWGSYANLQRVLKYVLLVFLAYIVTAFLARPHWGQVLHATLTPHLSFSAAYVAGAVALLGTTLTSYAYVWETIQTATDRQPLQRLGLVQVDAGVGMIAAGLIFYFIVVGTGATLGVHHTHVQTAQDAAVALAPLAGRFAAVLFGIGLLASAALALPVLAGTSAYVMAEAFGWRASLDARFSHAPAFYVTVLLSQAIGVSITLLGVGPIPLLFFSSIAGGLGTPVTLALMMLAARDLQVMDRHRIGPVLTVGGWLVTAVVTAACGLYLWQTFVPPGP